jgi:glycine betaine/proline transport system substrate-binding protein
MRTIITSIVASALGTVGTISTAVAADLVIGQQNWPSATATAYIIKAAIEQNLGLSVELQSGSNPIIFEAMDKGSMDVMPEVWLPNQQNLYDTYVTEKGSVALSQSGVEASQGICVPTYVAEEIGVTSVDDLTDPDKAALFDTDGDGKGEMWVGNPGDASGNVEKIKAKSYGYNETMKTEVYDETVNFANLGNAVKAHRPWVSACYSPHYIFSLYKLQMLKEPPYEASKWNVIQPTDDPDWLNKSSAAVSWPPTSVHVAYRKALEVEKPEVANFLRNMKLTTDQVSAMSKALVIEKLDPSTYAKKWVEDHQTEIAGWLVGK